MLALTRYRGRDQHSRKAEQHVHVPCSGGDTARKMNIKKASMAKMERESMGANKMQHKTSLVKELCLLREILFLLQIPISVLIAMF